MRSDYQLLYNQAPIQFCRKNTCSQLYWISGWSGNVGLFRLWDVRGKSRKNRL